MTAAMSTGIAAPSDLVDATVGDLRAGRRVLFVVDSETAAEEACRDVVDRISGEQVARVIRAAGQRRINMVNGGMVKFTSIHANGQRGMSVDTLVVACHLDDDMLGAALFALNQADAPRVVAAHKLSRIAD
ncbi:hypothetical protein [Gordonia terrae]|uniref:hypothetical protein n=1 Tax=Gordonia terrae TaxID=2055 RepID=UPI003F6A892E